MYNIALRQEGDQRVAKALENNVSSFGDTKQEALESIQEALELYEEDALQISLQPVISNIDFVSLSIARHA
jgi:predicted RNase H-like HicB family nuclease